MSPILQKTDIELINDFTLSGNMEVLGLLFSRYTHLVYGVCLKYLKNRDDAKDAVVSIFEKLATDIPKQNIANFKTWLFVVTKNFCLMALRKQKAAPNFDTLLLESSHQVMEFEPSVHPIDGNATEQLENALKQCIEKLNNDQKQCVNLFYYNNKCYQEISEQLNISPQKVKSYLQNGKRNLKICLENNHEVAI